MNLSEHFTLAEATLSETAARKRIDNTPPPEVMDALRRTALKMEKVRELLGKPITVTSWFRSLKLNAVIGSKSTSQHIKGEAVDFICPAFGTPTEVCRHLVQNQSLIRWDQLILEHTWVHISFSSDPAVKNRNEVLSLLESGSYAHGLTDRQGRPL